MYAIFALVLVGCGRKPSQNEIVNSKDTVVNSQLNSKDSVAVDDGFRDFIWSFQNSKDFQLNHIQFPLSVIENSQPSQITKENWKYISEGFVGGIDGILYNDTVNLEGRETFTQLSDTTYGIFGYFPVKKIFQEFYFSKKPNGWQLNKYCLEKFKPNNKTESFFEFVNRLNVDEAFLDSRISNEGLFIDHFLMDEDQPPSIEKLTKDNCNLDGNYIFQNLYFNQPILKTLADSGSVKLIHIQSEGTCYNMNWVFKNTKGKWYIIKHEFP
jgi:hypothetical protein